MRLSRTAVAVVLGVVLLFAVAAPTAKAGIITFTYTGNGTGTFDGTPFASDPFVAVFTGNTTGEVRNAFDFTLTVTGTIAVNGFGLATLTNPQTLGFQSAVLPVPPGHHGELYVTGYDGGGQGGCFFPAGWTSMVGTGPLLLGPRGSSRSAHLPTTQHGQRI